MNMISDGVRDHRWLAAAAAHVASAITERGLAASHLGVTREPSARFAALVLGCLRAGAMITVLEPENQVAPRFLGVSTVLDPDDLLRGLSGTAEGSGGSERLMAAAWAGDRIGPDDRVAVLSGVSGQIVSAVASTAASAAALHLDSPPVSHPGALGEWLRANEISVVFTTAPVLRALTASDEQLGALRQVVVENTGDLLAHDTRALRRVAPSCSVAATYRTSRHGSPLAVYDVPASWEPDDVPLRLPLGTFPHDENVRLLTVSGRPAAVGEIGELSLGDSPTGDLLRRWPDGSMEFVGFADTEADPVETIAALRELPEVRDAVVTEGFDANGEPVLVAYVTGPDPEAGPTAVRRALALRVAAAQVPAYLVIVPELPLTTEGGYDVDALPAPVPDGDDHVAPRTPLEEELTVILCGLLKTDRIGVLDSFFELGGFSLLATQLATRIRERFGIELSLREIFEAPTVDGLAQLIVRRELELSGSDDLEALLDEVERTDTGS
jgi:acyl carrier protein